MNTIYTQTVKIEALVDYITGVSTTVRVHLIKECKEWIESYKNNTMKIGELTHLVGARLIERLENTIEDLDLYLLIKKE